jgi:hypothetical protein
MNRMSCGIHPLDEILKTPRWSFSVSSVNSVVYFVY